MIYYQLQKAHLALQSNIGDVFMIVYEMVILEILMIMKLQY